MITANFNYRELPETYLFVNIARRVEEFKKNNPNRPLIRMGIGDVVLPLAPSVARAFSQAALDMATPEGFRGYGPEQGYLELRQAIAEFDYQKQGVSVDAAEIFVSDGSKCDVGHIQELFSLGIQVGIPDPVYPVYRDSNIMAGRKKNIVLLPSHKKNGMVPLPPDQPLDLIYLCSPNNPTGAVFTRQQLEDWVAYALKNKALILFDAAYAAFIQDRELPRSIFEISQARQCAIEFRSFSKSAGFTGVRCAFTVVPKELEISDGQGGSMRLWEMWNRRQSTLFNGVSWPVQQAALAVYSSEGQKETLEQVKIYQRNAEKLADFFKSRGFEVFGGRNAPYVWVDLGRDSWEAFDYFLNEAGIVVTPGSGFGDQGQGFIRLSAFQTPQKVDEAIEILRKLLKS
jgi:LL-diaminopimelate aminotransferase